MHNCKNNTASVSAKPIGSCRRRRSRYGLVGVGEADRGRGGSGPRSTGLSACMRMQSASPMPISPYRPRRCGLLHAFFSPISASISASREDQFPQFFPAFDSPANFSRATFSRAFLSMHLFSHLRLSRQIFPATFSRAVSSCNRFPPPFPAKCRHRRICTRL